MAGRVPIPIPPHPEDVEIEHPESPSEVSSVMIDRDFSDIVHGEDYEFRDRFGDAPPLLSSLNPLFLLRKFSDMQIVTLAGACLGFIAGIVVCPLDVIKTRLQAHGASPLSAGYSGLASAFKTIIKTEGVRGFYRGLVPITIGYLPTWTIYFSIYERAKTYYPPFMQRYFGLKSESIVHCMAAVTAGMALSIAVNPIWVVKTRLMVQGAKQSSPKTPTSIPKNLHEPTHYRGTFDAIRTMYKQEGLGVFYSGLVPSMFGLVHVGIYFPIYESFKKALKCDAAGIRDTSLDVHEGRSLVWRLIAASLASKILASTMTYPHEILRTRMQMQNHHEKVTVTQAIRTIYQNEGWRGFYAGYSVNMARTVPASAVTLVSFEFIKAYFMERTGR